MLRLDPDGTEEIRTGTKTAATQLSLCRLPRARRTGSKEEFLREAPRIFLEFSGSHKVK
jgi:hypothetical protein